jgi:hypothetical protein
MFLDRQQITHGRLFAHLSNKPRKPGLAARSVEALVHRFCGCVRDVSRETPREHGERATSLLLTESQVNAEGVWRSALTRIPTFSCLLASGERQVPFPDSAPKQIFCGLCSCSSEFVKRVVPSGFGVESPRSRLHGEDHGRALPK